MGRRGGERDEKAEDHKCKPNHLAGDCVCGASPLSAARPHARRATADWFNATPWDGAKGSRQDVEYRGRGDGLSVTELRD
ncbi:hypothetical protein Cob_v002295 [Colletotrichum orbiculare MAFF 240422]|uniref:Uncharacterized protein n=1 Tax=Colletotrichum orbiculare (strain 104-T / ATCC 96160 / CBS 514.97 / LARS 414 / MAFF 240422) TaxID=1213857 RepID=A0A484G4T2_COLOR|nr:hypothetical protein Cob_v002295 [Colletotrichum orbiculare MAFF 240422]